MIKPILPAVCAGLLIPLLGAQASDVQRRERVVVRPDLPWTHVAGETRPDRVILKFVEGLTVRLVDGRLRCLEGRDLSLVAVALEGAAVARLFTRTVEDLDAERARLQPRLPPEAAPLADLNNYYVVTTSGIPQTTRLVNALNELALVETAYAEPIPVIADGDIPPATPNFDANQVYLGAAPAGYEYRGIMSVVGARSPDHNMAHLEGSWEIGHEDHDLETANYLGGAPSGSYLSSGWRRHGTACSGIMAARRNSFGVNGMGSATPRFFLASLSAGSANIISLATAALGQGGVMSSSYVYVRTVNGRQTHTPLDYFQAQFDATRAAAAAGIFYTFSAGNTSNDLDDTATFGDRYLPTSQSSEGFIIGATEGGDLARAGFSSYGTRIDANGWGRNVATLGYGDLFEAGSDDRQDYTATFSGTSSAAPSVAGVIAALVGAVHEQNRRLLTVAEVRAALKATGTPIPGPENIGTRPRLDQLLARFGLPDGVLVTQQATVGGSFTFEVRGNAGETWGLAVSSRRGLTATPWNRPILLETTRMFAFAGGTLPAGGVVTRTDPVPNDPALRGMDFFLQGAFARSGTVHLSNSAELLVE